MFFLSFMVSSFLFVSYHTVDYSYLSLLKSSNTGILDVLIWPAAFRFFPLSFLSSLFCLLSIISVFYLTEWKHQGLRFRNDSAGSRGQRAACKASIRITKCTWQLVINAATKRGRVTMQSNRTQIHVSYSAHYQEGFEEWQVFNLVTLLWADANSRNRSCDTS